MSALNESSACKRAKHPEIINFDYSLTSSAAEQRTDPHTATVKRILEKTFCIYTPPHFDYAKNIIKKISSLLLEIPMF
jgi:hypothetical protein